MAKPAFKKVIVDRRGTGMPGQGVEGQEVMYIKHFFYYVVHCFWPVHIFI